MRKIIFIIFITLYSISFSYKIFLTPSYELYEFIKEKVIISNNVKFVSLSIDTPFLDILDNNKTKGYIEYEMMNFESSYILPDKNIDGYLHEKFIIFDDESVLFGTGNLTSGSIFEDLNVFVYSEDNKIVDLFQSEFNNFKNGNFGNKKRSIDKEVKSQDLGKIKFVTGPSKNIYNVVDNFINSSKKYLYIFSFSFTDGRILYDLEKLASRNVEVKIIADKWNIMNYSNIKYLKGIDYKIVNKYRNMHLKALINENGVLLGSYNLTYRAREKNDEYIIISSKNSLKNFFINLFNFIWNDNTLE
jgi:phosphatidylserine/phosphatidylglycerophosphate/cardiolipin synthase-like enzyme